MPSKDCRRTWHAQPLPHTSDKSENRSTAASHPPQPLLRSLSQESLSWTRAWQECQNSGYRLSSCPEWQRLPPRFWSRASTPKSSLSSDYRRSLSFSLLISSIDCFTEWCSLSLTFERTRVGGGMRESTRHMRRGKRGRQVMRAVSETGLTMGGRAAETKVLSSLPTHLSLRLLLQPR